MLLPRLYADDTTLVSTVSAFKQNAGAPDCKLLSDNINYELTRINEWLALNKLNLNINKTKYIIFHFPQRNMANVGSYEQTKTLSSEIHSQDHVQLTNCTTF